ncbi:MAG: hypothetical protein ABEI06_08800 [Halobacteriaceae archaeon]
MPDRSPVFTLSMTVILVIATILPVAALPIMNEGDQSRTQSNINANVGQQISTVISVASSNIQSVIEQTEFMTILGSVNPSERAEVIADRAEKLQAEAHEIIESYREAIEKYKTGEITKNELARRIAVLNANAKDLLHRVRKLRKMAQNVSQLALKVAGFNSTAFNRTVSKLDRLTGKGPNALLEQFLGNTDGAVTLQTENGITIIEKDDGEFTKEIERSGDNTTNLSITQTKALEIARNALKNVSATWQLVESDIKFEEGQYTFAFSLRNKTVTGEAEVVVDGSSGTIVELEEEIEFRATEEDKDTEDEEDEEDEKNETEEKEDANTATLNILIANGTVTPNTTITIKILANGTPVSNVTVLVNDTVIGKTDGNGTISLQLPTDDVEITAIKGDTKVELDLEFEEREEDEVLNKLNVTATLQNKTVTLVLSYNGSAIQGAKVYWKNRLVGTTDQNGTISFSINNETDEIELKIVKGELEVERTYSVNNGTLTGGEEENQENETEDEDTESKDDEEKDDEEENQENETEDEDTESQEGEEDSS